jgi:hypothetical protein
MSNAFTGSILPYRISSEFTSSVGFAVIALVSLSNVSMSTMGSLSFYLGSSVAVVGESFSVK